MKKYLFAAAMVAAVAAPAFADDVGVHVGPVGAGVTVGAAATVVFIKRSSRSTQIGLSRGLRA